MALSFASQMAAAKSPLQAAFSFYGVPKANKDLASLPISTPVQAHFGSLDTVKGLSDPATATQLAQAWYVP